MSLYVILHNIRSSENVGSIFRTSDAAGVEKVFLTGYTPSPIDRFGRKNQKLSKASLGAEGFVQWESKEDIMGLLEELKKKGVETVAVEQSEKSIALDSYEQRGATAFIFGNEVEGLPQNVLSVADQIVEISMKGKKESLNVSVVAGIMLFCTSD